MKRAIETGVVAVTDFATFMQNAGTWARDRNIDKVEFNWSGLLKNCMDEWQEGCTARLAVVQANLALATATVPTVIDELLHTKTMSEEAIVDAYADQLIYMCVDHFKINGDRALVLDEPEEELVQNAAATIERIIDPGCQLWLYQGKLQLAYLATCAAIYGYNYNPDKVFTECFKEIFDRDGKWNPELGKWDKKVIEGKEYYKADFSRCKLIESEYVGDETDEVPPSLFD